MTLVFSLRGLVLSVLTVISVKLVTAGNAGYGAWPTLPARSPLLQELRLKVQGTQINPLWTTDRNLARLIVETGYSVDKSVRKLRRTASFRAKVKADHLLDWTPAEHFSTDLPYECSGYANDGSPVILFPFGRWDTPKFLKVARSKDLYMYFLRMLEDARARTAGRFNPKSGDSVDQAVFIVDAKGYNLKKLLNVRVTWTFLRIAYTIDRHYPFLAQKWYVVNAPLVFQVFWKLVRLVATQTLERAVDIYNPYTKRGANALAHNIPKEAIPVSLGGTYLPKYEQQATPAPPLPSLAASWSNALSAWPSTAGAPWPVPKSTAVKCAKCTDTPNSSGYGPPPPPAPVQYGPPSIPAPAPKPSGYGAPQGPPPSESSPKNPANPASTGYSFTPLSPPASPQYGPPISLKPQSPKMIVPWTYGGYA